MSLPSIRSLSTSTSPPTSTSPFTPTIHPIFESSTGTWQYIVACPSTHRAAIIDPVLDYDRATQTVSPTTALALLEQVSRAGYTVEMILESHVHADHLTAAFFLQNRLARAQGGLRPPIGIGKRVEQVQRQFGRRYSIGDDEYVGVFDRLFDDNEIFAIGDLRGEVMHLPGHTPDHLGYKFGDDVFCGDSLFHPDIGTARCDFPGGSSEALFRSGRRLLALPGHVRIWTGHDYPPADGARPAVPWTSVAEHRAQNKHLMDGISQQDFVALRSARDASMAAPKLLHPSLQINIRAGRMPSPTDKGDRLLHLPMKGGDLV
ncbi:hypothetical protein ASPZODRAFT_67281 [Penicilliopsis zonata CBS 506.65]|uniref:Metallo-beta-lactamase domain-containing protein n=1 Tax=Penicilliopsis zonata CBS 506.65 TaxID=1073090 RepID=A0A1L9SFV0_9EURO|nr:hypothetical protein ASPZODRAFT_67281 [Penicilliopsis zonata CBS 506.65]OJJ46003.1 hypothetical protein ASPZODRAFT_67281 [Penicilliopsis zonata CBS 506.65]